MTAISPPRAATFARIQHYGDMKADPRTATCDQHKVASPYSDTAKGDGVALTCTHWKCVVCPLPDADLIGTDVIVTTYSGVYRYGGVDGGRFPGGVSLKVGIGSGGPAVVSCDVDLVAPADVRINEKNPRISIEKLPKKRDYQDGGVWLPHVDHPGVDDSRWTAKKSKRDAVAYAARRLAIAEYHADWVQT